MVRVLNEMIMTSSVTPRTPAPASTCTAVRAASAQPSANGVMRVADRAQPGDQQHQQRREDHRHDERRHRAQPEQPGPLGEEPESLQQQRRPADRVGDHVATAQRPGRVTDLGALRLGRRSQLVGERRSVAAVRAGSPVARIRAASRPAFRALPIATVATGTPLGICTIDSSESIPSRYFSGTGTPITGSGVRAASMPGQVGGAPGPGDDHLEPAGVGLPAVARSSPPASGARRPRRPRRRSSNSASACAGGAHHRPVGVRAHHDADPDAVARVSHVGLPSGSRRHAGRVCGRRRGRDRTWSRARPCGPA